MNPATANPLRIPLPIIILLGMIAFLFAGGFAWFVAETFAPRPSPSAATDASKTESTYANANLSPSDRAADLRIAAAQGATGDPRAVVDRAIISLADPSPQVRAEAVRLIAQRGTPDDQAHLAAAARDDNGAVAGMATRFLAESDDPASLTALTSILADPTTPPARKLIAIQGIRRNHAWSPVAVESLLAALADPEATVREYADRALRSITRANPPGPDRVSAWSFWWAQHRASFGGPR